MDVNKWLLDHLAGADKRMQYWNSLDADHPIGDSPEMMLLDSSLFQDLHAGIWHHARMRTTLLNNDDPRKFSLTKPKEITHSYMHLFNPALGSDASVPCSQCILQDCKTFVSNCNEICKVKDVVVPSLESRKGH